MKAILVGSVFLLTIAACSTGTDNSPDSANAQFAQDTCRKSVEQQLTSPATAHFHDETRTYTGTATDPESFDVTGQVDSENGFGALLTSSWSCTASSTDGGHYWTAYATLGN